MSGGGLPLRQRMQRSSSPWDDELKVKQLMNTCRSTIYNSNCLRLFICDMKRAIYNSIVFGPEESSTDAQNNFLIQDYVHILKGISKYLMGRINLHQLQGICRKYKLKVNLQSHLNEITDVIKEINNTTQTNSIITNYLETNPFNMLQ
jgi:hypothetical protein